MNTPPVSGFPDDLGERYQPEYVLGEGGMGTVFAAHDRELDRRVAVKCMRDPGRAGLLDRFEREAAVLANLQHPNVVRLYTYGSLREGGVYLVMELLEGSSLEDLPSGPEAVTSLLDAARALHEVHRQGLVHRDVKPGNVFRTRDGRGLLVDFGLVLDERLARLTATGALVGTLATMAPEQLQGAIAGPPADWYGLGACLFQAIEDRMPYTSEALFAHVAGQRPLPPAPFRRLGAGHPLRATLAGLLSPRPEERLAVLPALIPAAEAWLQGTPTASPPVTWASAARPPATRPSASRDGAGFADPPPPAPQPGRGRALRLGGALVAAAGLALGLRALAPGRAPPPPRGEDSPRILRDRLEGELTELLEGHRHPCPEGLCFLVSSDREHTEAVAAQLVDPRFALRLRRVLDAFLTWWWARPAQAAPPPEEQTLVRLTLVEGVPHLLRDLARLAAAGPEANPPSGWAPTVYLEALAAAQRSLADVRATVAAALNPDDLLEGKSPDLLLPALAALAGDLRPPQVARLREHLRLRSLTSGTDRSLLLDARLRLARALLGRIPAECEGIAAELQGAADLAAGRPPDAALPAVLGRLQAWLLRGLRSCPSPTFLGLAERLEGLLLRLPPGARFTAEQLRDTRLLQALLAASDAPGARTRAARLWWWSELQRYLLYEDLEIRRSLEVPADQDLDHSLGQLAQGLPATPRREDLAAACRALIHLTHADALRARPEALRHALAMVRALAARDPRPDHERSLVVATLYRLAAPLAPPRGDRILLAARLSEGVIFPFDWYTAWALYQDLRPDLPAALQGEIRAVTERFRGRVQGYARIPRQLAVSATQAVDACSWWAAGARAFGEGEPDGRSRFFLDSMRFETRTHLAYVATCLRTCDPSRCLDDLRRLEEWKELLQSPLTPSERLDLVGTCQGLQDEWRRPSIPRGPEIDELVEHFRGSCSTLGVELADVRGP